MKKGRLYSKPEIITISKSLCGKSINEILKENNVLKPNNNPKNKGGIGQLIEKHVFGIETNNNSEPDFMPVGIELKVTPYRKLKNGKLSAKERLVFNIIDYMNEYKLEFQKSHFWFKNNTIELLWYLWEPNKDKHDMKITHEKFLELATNPDLKQIEEDWNLIITKIKEGKAHEISEADTMYLGASPKGSSSKSLRKQPFSDTPAMQRSFCFKISYMNQLVRKYIGDYSNVEKILQGTNFTITEYVNNIIKKYQGKSTKELMHEFKITSKPKNINSILIHRMFNVKSRLEKTEEFQKANIVPKTIRIEKNGKLKESLSFPYFKFTDILDQTWETSDLKEQLETTKYMFFVFKKTKNDYIFKGIKIWNMPLKDVESSVKDMWQKTYDTIKSGNIIKSITNGKRKTNFPSKRENQVCHVRPHGRNAKDTTPLPVKDQLTGATKYTKHCFWLNNTYIQNILKEFND